MLNVVMLSIVMLNFVMLSVIMLNVVMLSVVASRSAAFITEIFFFLFTRQAILMGRLIVLIPWYSIKYSVGRFLVSQVLVILD